MREISLGAARQTAVLLPGSETVLQLVLKHNYLWTGTKGAPSGFIGQPGTLSIIIYKMVNAHKLPLTCTYRKHI